MVMSDEAQLSEANVTAFVDETSHGINEPHNALNALSETKATSSSEEDRMEKRGLETIETCESLLAKRARVKYNESLRDRLVIFMNWYKASESKSISLFTGTALEPAEVFADQIWFKELLTDKGHLHEQHVDAYVSLLKRRMGGHPEAFKRGSVLLNYEFATAMAACSVPHPVLYVNIWKPNTRAYTLWRIESDHWVAVVMSVKDWTMYVFDSFVGNKNIDLNPIMKQLDGWAHYMRVVLQASPFLRDLPEMVDDSKPPFKIDFLAGLNLPQMKGRADCIVYAIKYIEELITVGHIRRVCGRNMMGFRSQISADLYCQHVHV